MENKSFFAKLQSAIKNYLVEPEPVFEEMDESWYDEVQTQFDNPEQWKLFENNEKMDTCVFENIVEFFEKDRLPDSTTLMADTGVYGFIAELTSLCDPLSTVCQSAIEDASGFEPGYEEPAISEKTITIGENIFLLKATAFKNMDNISLTYYIQIN